MGWQSNEVGGGYYFLEKELDEESGIAEWMWCYSWLHCHQRSSTNSEVPRGEQHHPLLWYLAHGKKCISWSCAFCLFCTSRLHLAAMYYNKNGDCAQIKTYEGVPLLKVYFPKAIMGGCRANPLKREPTFRKCFTLNFQPKHALTLLDLLSHDLLSKNFKPKI